MKLRKFFGLTSRQVLEQVRTELGPDAVIVANRPTADGIEITALAGDAMESILEKPARTDTAPVAPEQAPTSTVEMAKSSRGPVPFTFPMAAPAETSAPAVEATRSTGALDETLGARLMEEMAAMRAAFEAQLAQLTWSEALRRSPLRARFTRELLAAGYSPALTREITQRLPDDYNAAQAQDWLLKVLVRNLRCADATEDIVSRGGVYALVGPTGVGKTTTTAKLAARCAVRYGASKLALLTTDSYRVGAHDQLRIYGKILGVPVQTVTDRQDLDQALDSIRGKQLVLIDTVGMSQRDERVREQATLLAHPQIKRLLLVNAAAQSHTLEEVVDSYCRAPELASAPELAGCVLTKLDEAGQPGQALDAIIRHRLFLQYTSSGQRVPEDLHSPEAEELVQRSLQATSKPALALNDDAFSLITGLEAARG